VTQYMSAQHTKINDVIDLGSIGYRPTPSIDDIVSENAVQVSLISLDEIDEALRVEWRTLSNAAGAPNPNFAPWFLEPAMRHLDSSREVKLGLLRWGTSKLLVGLAPLVLSKRYAKTPLRHLRIWMPQHCFNSAPMIRDGFETAVYAGLFEWLDTRPFGARSLRFPSLPLDRRMYLAMEEACDLTERSFHVPNVNRQALLTEQDGSDADLLEFCLCRNHPRAAEWQVECTPTVNVKINAKRFSGETLLRRVRSLKSLRAKR